MSEYVEVNSMSTNDGYICWRKTYQEYNIINYVRHMFGFASGRFAVVKYIS